MRRGGSEAPVGAGPPVSRGPQSRAVCDPTAGLEAPLLSRQVSRCMCLALSAAALLAVADLLAARELELGSALGLSHMPLVLHVGADGLHGLADRCALEISKGTALCCVEPGLGTVWGQTHIPQRGLSQVPSGSPDKQQVPPTAQEAAVCSHCTPGCTGFLT